MEVVKSNFSSFKLTSMGVFGWLLFLIVAVAVAVASSSSTPSSQTTNMEQSLLRVGPWGGHDGETWTYEPQGDISHISIVYEKVIHSISFTSIDPDGNVDVSDKFGCKKGSNKAEIDIDVQTEKLNGISGTIDTHKSSKIITSLSFTTNQNKTYGPFGTLRGTAFSLKVKDNAGFIGFHGQSAWLLDSIGVSLPFTTTQSIKPWGGPGGENQYDYRAKGDLSRISIRYEGGIRSIIFTSKDKSGHLDTSRRIGGAGGDWDKTAEIVLDTNKGEKLVGISGTVGTYLTFLVITSLKFYTNTKKSFGPFGSKRGTPFSHMGNNTFITGFYGRDGGLLDSIGLHEQAARPYLEFGEWGTTSARDGWSYQPQGGISHISITYDDVICSIIFTGKDENGNLIHSNKYGRNIGSKKVEIDIDTKNEKLNNISGTFGAKNGSAIITSLSFSTDKGRSFGPFGTLMGTTFSLPLTNGFISGFHGHSGKWVEAIGAYAKPI